MPKIVIYNDDGTEFSSHDFPEDDNSILYCVTEACDTCLDATLAEDMGLEDRDWYRGTHLLECIGNAGYGKPARTLKDYLADYEIKDE